MSIKADGKGINPNTKKKLKLRLEKLDLIDIKARTGLAIDVSPSTNWLYARGMMDKIVEPIVAVALRFDDNGELDMWTFDDNAFELPACTELNFDGFVQREIVNSDKRSRWGGTAYAPAIQAAIDSWFGESPLPKSAPQSGGFLGRFFGSKAPAAPVSAPVQPAKDMPSFLMVVTDGQNAPGDRPKVRRVLELAKKHEVYVSFLGVGTPSEFSFIEEVANEYPNVGFANVNDIEKMTDDQLYDLLITDELAAWLKNAVQV